MFDSKTANLDNQRFPVIAHNTRGHTCTNESNHARARSQYFNENFYCKICERVLLFKLSKFMNARKRQFQLYFAVCNPFVRE